MHAVKLFVLAWLATGTATAMAGLIWTCWKSSKVLGEAKSSSSVQ
jgi:hypothetical protein